MSLDTRPDDEVLLASRVEIEYWTLRFNASEWQVRRAIDAVGTHPARVQAWLREMNRGNGSEAGGGFGRGLASALRNVSFFAIGICGAAAFLN